MNYIMNIKKIILTLLVLLPIIEIILFVEIGSIIGSFYTIAVIIISSLIGIYLIKNHAPSKKDIKYTFLKLKSVLIKMPINAIPNIHVGHSDKEENKFSLEL